MYFFDVGIQFWSQSRDVMPETDLDRSKLRADKQTNKQTNKQLRTHNKAKL